MVPEVVQPIWLNQIHFVLRTPDKVNSLPDFAPDFLDCIFRASIAQQPFYSPALSLVFSLCDSKESFKRRAQRISQSTQRFSSALAAESFCVLGVWVFIAGASRSLNSKLTC